MAKPIKSDLDFENVARILNLLDPTAAQHPATKAYVDAAIEGVAWKDSCRVASTANINLASPGTTINSITMATGDRFLAKDQTTGAENGIYVWNGSAVAATRAPDCSTAAELEQAVTTVEEGTSAGATYRQTSVNFTLGSGAVAWTTFGTAAGAASETTAGIAELATQAETDAGSDDARIVTPLKLATWSGRIKKYSTLIGDGSATQYDVTHNLGSTQVVVQAFIESSGVEVDVQVTRTSTSVARLNFAAAPTSNQIRVVVVG